MGFNTKIVILKAKELIYTGVFVALGFLLLILLLWMFLPNHGNTEPSETTETSSEALTTEEIHDAASTDSIIPTVPDMSTKNPIPHWK